MSHMPLDDSDTDKGPGKDNDVAMSDGGEEIEREFSEGTLSVISCSHSLSLSHASVPFSS